MTDERKTAQQWSDDGESKGLRELISQGVELVRIDHETMQKVAILHKRSPRDCLARAIAELEEYPEIANEAWYSIPFKKGRDSEEVVNVEGPSIKAALPILRSWGNANVTTRFTEDTKEFIDIAARFLDYETNFVIERPYRVYKKARKYGKTVDLRPDQLVQAVQAGVSKGIRNVIEAGLPRGFLLRYVERARELVAGENPKALLDEDTLKKLVAAFEKLGVAPELLEAKRGKKLKAFNGLDRAALIGNYNAIVEGSSSVEELFSTYTKRTDGPKQETVTATSSKPPSPSVPDPVLDAIENAPASVPETARQPVSKTSEEVEKLKPGAQNESALRSKLGIESPSISEVEPAEVLAASRSNPLSTYEGVHPAKDEQPTPPRGVPIATGEGLSDEECELADEAPDRQAHLAADAELAKQDGLFNEGGHDEH